MLIEGGANKQQGSKKSFEISRWQGSIGDTRVTMNTKEAMFVTVIT